MVRNKFCHHQSRPPTCQPAFLFGKFPTFLATFPRRAQSRQNPQTLPIPSLRWRSYPLTPPKTTKPSWIQEHLFTRTKYVFSLWKGLQDGAEQLSERCNHMLWLPQLLQPYAFAFVFIFVFVFASVFVFAFGSHRSSNLPTSCLTSTSLLGSTTKNCKSRIHGSWNSAKLTRVSLSLWVSQFLVWKRYSIFQG